MLNMIRIIVAVLLLFLTACAAPISTPTPTITPFPTPASTADAIEIETYQIYSTVLSELMFEDNSIVVLASDTYITDLDDYGGRVDPVNSIRRNVRGLEESTLESFVEVADESIPLKDRFDPDVNVELLTIEESRAIFAGRDDPLWKSFYRVFPESIGLHHISRVGLNTKMTQALLDLYWQGSRRGCSGDRYLLEKENGQWTIVFMDHYLYC
jgi:hypothetical protein